MSPFDASVAPPCSGPFSGSQAPKLYLFGSLIAQTPCHTGLAVCMVESESEEGPMSRCPRLTVGEGTRTSRCVLAMAAVFLATVAGCDTEPAVTTSTNPPATTTASSVPSSSTTTVPTPTTSAPNTTATTANTNGEEAAVEAWNQFWAAWVEVRGSEDLDRGPLEASADPSVVDGVIALFERQRQTSGPVDTEVATHPKVTIDGTSAAVIEDCVLLQPTFAESVGVWYEADLQSGDDGWRITDLSIRSLQGCVPAAVEAAAISAYEAYYDAREHFWDPPEPASPLLDEVLAEPQLGFVRDLLEEYATRGAALRGRPTTHPEVVEVRGSDELVILSCIEPHPEYGLFDLDTDERLPDEPVVESGQRDLESAVMKFVDDTWKVADLQGQVDFECEFAPTERGLPSV